MKWREVSKRVEEISNQLSPLCGVELVGVARRELDLALKLEVLLFPVVNTDVIERALYPEITIELEDTEVLFGTDHAIGVPVELYRCSIRTRGSALLSLIGSRSYYRNLQFKAKDKGYELRREGLFKESDCVASETEEEICKHIGVKWVEPRYRTRRGAGRRLADVQSYVGGRVHRTKKKVPRIEIIAGEGKINIVWFGLGQFYRMFLYEPDGSHTSKDFIEPGDAPMLIQNWLRGGVSRSDEKC